MTLRVFIGFDPRFAKAYAVASRTAESFGCHVTQLREDSLRMSGMLTRPTDRRGGEMWDLNSNASQSTEFALSRFFVPLLAHSGWCLFTDSDVVFVADPHELFALADERFAVMVVQHEHFALTASKMDDQTQAQYPRKLWSSVVLWNCDHPANRRLNLTTLNQWPRHDLHAFAWLADIEIGDLPSEWNFLVGINAKPEAPPKILHYTEGTPDLPGYEHCDYAEIWNKEAAACL